MSWKQTQHNWILFVFSSFSIVLLGSYNTHKEWGDSHNKFLCPPLDNNFSISCPPSETCSLAFTRAQKAECMTDGPDDLQGPTCCPEALHSQHPGHSVIEAHRGMLEARAGARKGCGKKTQDQFGDFGLSLYIMENTNLLWDCWGEFGQKSTKCWDLT